MNSLTNSDLSYSILSHLDIQSVLRYSQVSKETRKNAFYSLNLQFNTFLKYGKEKGFESLAFPTLQARVYRILSDSRADIDCQIVKKNETFYLLTQIKTIFDLFDICYQTGAPSIRLDIAKCSPSFFWGIENRAEEQSLGSNGLNWLIEQLKKLRLFERKDQTNTLLKKVGYEAMTFGFFTYLPAHHHELNQKGQIYFFKKTLNSRELSICNMEKYFPEKSKVDSASKWEILKRFHEEYFQKFPENENVRCLVMSDLIRNRQKRYWYNKIRVKTMAMKFFKMRLNREDTQEFLPCDYALSLSAIDKDSRENSKFILNYRDLKGVLHHDVLDCEALISIHQLKLVISSKIEAATGVVMTEGDFYENNDGSYTIQD